MAKRIYFMDDKVIYRGKKIDPVKKELFNLFKIQDSTYGYDKDNNLYKLDNVDLIIEED